MQIETNLSLLDSDRSEQAHPAKRRIMVVDNIENFNAAHPVCDPLTEIGYQVSHHLNPSEALALFKLAGEHAWLKPDLIIVDHFLNEMDGLEFISELRRLQNSWGILVPILMSAQIENNALFEQAVQQTGADDFVAYPIRPADLRLRVHRLLKGVPGGIKEQQQNFHRGDQSLDRVGAIPSSKTLSPFATFRTN